ncbi:MAG: hypothetical protein H3C48_18800, partial [Chitinophagaceae bacterium]|nr:hypothetical protein [Chitinophagaceae bacterium]
TDSEAAKVHERLSLLQTGKSDKEAEVSALGVQLKEKILWETSCKPELDKARQLDIQLDERHNQIRQLESDEKELSLSLDKMEQEVAGQEAEWLSLEDALAKSEQWFTAHEQRRRVAENKDLIIAKLTEASELYGRVSRLINGIQSANNQVGELTKEKEEDEKEVLKIISIRTEKQKELDNSASTLGNVDINRLQNEKSKKDAVLNDLVEAKANWERIYQEGFSLKSLRKELTLNDEKREATEAELEKALHDFQTKETEKEAAFGILENARLAVTESLEKVRARLRENEACPVCGSIHHPYVSEHPVYKEVLTSVERDYKQSEESYGKELARKTRLEQMLDNLKELRLRTRTEIDDKEKVIQDLRAKWEKSRVYVKMIDVIEEERTEWLGLELNRIRDEQEQLLEELRSYNEKRERMDKYRNELTDIDKELNSLQNRIKDIERERKTLEIQKDNDISEHKGTEEKLQTLRSMLAEYFSSDDWFKNWRENPVSFAEQIEKFADDWKEKVEQRDRNKSTRDIIEERVKGLNKQVDVLRRSLTDHQDKLKRVSEDHEKLRGQRKLIFDGRPIADVETEIKSAVENSRNALDNTRKEMTAFAQQISAEEGRYEQLQKNRQGFTIRLESVEKTIDEWLSEYNTRYQSDQTLDDIRGLLAFQRDWMEEERTDLERIDTELAKAKSVLLERSRDLENHERQKNSDLSFEELAKQK